MLSLAPYLPERAEYPPGEAVREVSILLSFIIMGWVDATTGAVMPAIRTHYNINFIIASMLFIGNFCGSLSSTVVTPLLVTKVGFGKALTFSVLLALVCPAIFIPKPPFPALVIGMVVSGLSSGMLDALANVYIAARPKPHVRLGLLHFLYGLGALLAPLAAVVFVENTEDPSSNGPKYNLFYAITLSMAGVMLALITGAFRLRRLPHLEAVAAGREDGDNCAGGGVAAVAGTDHAAVVLPTVDEEAAVTPVKEKLESGDDAMPPPRRAKGPSTRTSYIGLARSRTTWLLSTFCLLYVGTEVSIGGWITSFLLQKGNAIASSTYIVSGYWAGIAAGRILLIPLSTALGDARAVLVYLSCAAALQAVIWRTPNLIANAVCLAFQGVFLGPIFPIMIHYLSQKKKDPALLTLSMTFVISFGSAGSALLPLVVGLSAEAASMGIEILAPIAIGTLVAQLCVWTAMVGPSRIMGRSSGGVGGGGGVTDQQPTRQTE